jgi:hypothetical protein
MATAPTEVWHHHPSRLIKDGSNYGNNGIESQQIFLIDGFGGAWGDYLAIIMKIYSFSWIIDMIAITPWLLGR